MPHAFIVMQIGDTSLDEMCRRSIVPAITACGLEARRVDKHNQGGILKSEIVQFLETSEIIVADLTNERPNVYLEIGYAMGLDKFRNLILTVRHDHFLDSPKYVRGGPRIHFDLAGYEILAWHPENLDEFRMELEKRIRRRRAVVALALPSGSALDDVWIEDQRNTANAGLANIGRSGFMEVRAGLLPPKPDKNQRELNQAARASQIETFGWPIAVYVDDDRFRPRPRADGIFASIAPESKQSYDYWTIRRNGDVFIVGSLFEDEQRSDTIFFDTRIIRVAEAFLYLLRLYSQLGIDRATRVEVVVRHGGLRGRVLSASSPRRLMHSRRSTQEDRIESPIHDSLEGLEANLAKHVEAVVAPLLTLFDFFELRASDYEQLVNDFVAGVVR
jgi:hypothetical protein